VVQEVYVQKEPQKEGINEDFKRVNPSQRFATGFVTDPHV
jgi:hypothetical protein